MLTLGFSTYDLAHTRFASSPLQEVVASVRVLKDPAGHALHLPWAVKTQHKLDETGFDLSPLADLIPVPSWYIPDFLTPPPTTPLPDFQAELATFRATPEAQVRADLERLGTDHAPSVAQLHHDPVAGMARLAEVIESYWGLTIAAHWLRIRAVLEGDVLYRARRLAEGGAALLFQDLAPVVRWQQDTLQVAHPRYSGNYHLDGQGLLLVPSVFVWPTVFSSTIPPWQPTLTYPARGVALLWERSRTPTPDALAAVIGRSRALLLAELAGPASTTELAHRTGMSVGSVSPQLTALRGAGLITAHRTGRYVLYARTTVAEALLAASTDTQPA